MIFKDRPVALCDVCGGEVYGEDIVHVIDSFVVCPECFSDFVFEYFEDCMTQGSKIVERLGRR